MPQPNTENEQTYTLLGGSPENTEITPGKARVTVRGFVEITPNVVQSNDDEYIQETVKTRVSEGTVYIDSILHDGEPVDEPTSVVTRDEAEKGYMALTGWNVVTGNRTTDPDKDYRVNVTGFVEIPEPLIESMHPWENRVEIITEKTSLSNRQAQVFELKRRGLTHRQIDNVLGIGPGNADEHARRFSRKIVDATQQKKEAEATLDLFTEMPEWRPPTLDSAEELAEVRPGDLTIETDTVGESMFVTYMGWEWTFKKHAEHAVYPEDRDGLTLDDYLNAEWEYTGSEVEFSEDGAFVIGETEDEIKVERSYRLQNVHPADVEVRSKWREQEGSQ